MSVGLALSQNRAFLVCQPITKIPVTCDYKFRAAAQTKYLGSIRFLIAQPLYRQWTRNTESQAHGRTIPRARIKNSPDGKKNDRRSTGPNTTRAATPSGKLQRHDADRARIVTGMAPDTHDGRVLVVLSAIIKSEDLSFRGIVKHLRKHPEDSKRASLPEYARSAYRRQIEDMDSQMQQKLITRLAGDDAVHDTMHPRRTRPDDSLAGRLRAVAARARRMCGTGASHIWPSAPSVIKSHDITRAVLRHHADTESKSCRYRTQTSTYVFW